MSIFDFFHRYNSRKQRRAEIEFNRNMAELNRKASGIKRSSDQLKEKAIQLEGAGDHQRAVSVAAIAVRQEKTYNSAMETLQTCKNMNAQVKSQKALEDLLGSCSKIAQSVCGKANPSKCLEAQSKFAQVRDELSETNEILASTLEGFNTDTEAQVRNEAGENALAQIMAERTSAQAEPPVAPPVSEKASTDDQHKAWADDRRKILAEMM